MEWIHTTFPRITRKYTIFFFFFQRLFFFLNAYNIILTPYGRPHLYRDRMIRALCRARGHGYCVIPVALQVVQTTLQSTDGRELIVIITTTTIRLCLLLYNWRRIIISRQPLCRKSWRGFSPQTVAVRPANRSGRAAVATRSNDSARNNSGQHRSGISAASIAVTRTCWWSRLRSISRLACPELRTERIIAIYTLQSKKKKNDGRLVCTESQLLVAHITQPPVL